MPGTLFVVATPIGNLEDISGRALRVLRQVALIAAEDTRRTARLLARYGITTPATSLHEHNERRKTPAILKRLLKGDDVALVSDSGTPTVSDPGRHLIRDATGAGIQIEPIPGPSAAIAALSVSGFPGDMFTFLGFPPIRSRDRSAWFDTLEHTVGSVVFFEAPHRVRKTLEELRRRIGDVEIVVTREMTKVHAELVKQPISCVLTALTEPRGEITVVLFLGHKTNIAPAEAPDDADLANEFCRLTDHCAMTRREALRKLAGRYDLTQRQVYSAIERSKIAVQ